jgi:hypothetical protein
MPEGEVVKQSFFKLFEVPEIGKKTDVPSFSGRECCFALPALADDSNDVYKNDRHSIIERYDANFYASASIFMQKYVNGSFVDLVELTDNTYGTNYSFGTLTDKNARLKYVAYHIEWAKVLAIHGEGTYRFKFKSTTTSAVDFEKFYIFEFCLKTYLDHRANFTTRFDWYTKGFRGDSFIDKSVWDFTQVTQVVGVNGWYNQIRLPESFFGYNKSSYEREYVKYDNGQMVWLKDEQIETYTWNSGQYPALLHDYIKTDILQADRILVTDYNSKNPNVITDKAVNPDGAYEPDWQYNNLRAFVNIDFVQEFQNRKKLRC